MSLPFLLEIGTEEIPDWMIVPALDHLKQLFSETLTANNLSGTVSRVDATPRRLVLRAEGLPQRQQDRSELLSGPAKGAPEKALEGFARKSGVTVDKLVLTATAKGEYWSYSKTIEGRATRDVLAQALPGLITRIYFPKTMCWTGKNGPRFIRPIRWIVALLGDEIVPFELAGVRAGNATSGHRRLGAAKVIVNCGNFESELARNFVILSAEDRRQRIESALQDGVKRDESLLTTLVYLTEYPTPIRGGFDHSYLDLPGEILSTVMRHHQRYFSVEREGKLAAEFVAVMNTSADPEGLVRKGNERVLRARFNDARFFWEVDMKRKLDERLQDLRNVTFQARLGNYYEKTERNVALAGELARHVGADVQSAQRAALLAKCDLTTDMVKEFTELQGVVGGLYARRQGEPEAVWRAVYEHYKPVSMEDSIPATLTGQVVSLADKLDTLTGCFGVGLVPTGSKDPFALRRAAQGVIKIVIEGRLPVDVFALSKSEELHDFLLDRVRYYFRDVRGYRFDEVNAVLAAGYSDLVDVESRLQALRQVRPTENFEPLAAGFKRIKNILKGETVTSVVSDSLFEPGPEADLHQEYLRVRKAALDQRARRDYQGALESIASLRPAVDLFFDKVLVNAPDAAIRANRLALLHHLLTEFSAIADFSEIQTQ